MPNFPKICTTLSKKFPEHPNKLQLEKVRILIARMPLSTWNFA
jgi:hypothetical protein